MMHRPITSPGKTLAVTAVTLTMVGASQLALAQGAAEQPADHDCAQFRGDDRAL